MTTSSSKLVAQALAEVDDLTPEQVAKRVEAGATLIDLREEAEVTETGTIPGAVTVPRGLLEFRADPDSEMHLEGLDPAKPTILYCSAGGRSALGAKALRDLGYADVAHLGGGMGSWQADGRPTDRS